MEPINAELQVLAAAERVVKANEYCDNLDAAWLAMAMICCADPRNYAGDYE